MLEARDLSVSFGSAAVLRGLSFTLRRGESLGVVGESGSGKTLTALAIIGLLPKAARASGEIRLEGRDLLALPEREKRKLRGRRIGMIFQEPATALNPSMRVGLQIAEGLRLHHGVSASAARSEALRLMERVKIADSARRIDSYPHELSGGQRQRIGIAIALAPGPEILLADEPTTALDATVQQEILTLLDDLVTDLNLALMFISHNLGVIARISDRVLVLRRGEMMEEGPVEDVLRRPRTDYARTLLAALPRRLRPAVEGGGS